MISNYSFLMVGGLDYSAKFGAAVIVGKFVCVGFVRYESDIYY
jgi:hypothetical protein